MPKTAGFITCDPYNIRREKTYNAYVYGAFFLSWLTYVYRSSYNQRYIRVNCIVRKWPLQNTGRRRRLQQGRAVRAHLPLEMPEEYIDEICVPPLDPVIQWGVASFRWYGAPANI